MIQVPISKAKAALSSLVARACAGEEIVIARGKRPLVRLVPVEGRAPRRQFGALKGLIHLDETFFDPLPEEELRLWEGRDPPRPRRKKKK